MSADNNFCHHGAGNLPAAPAVSPGGGPNGEKLVVMEKGASATWRWLVRGLAGMATAGLALTACASGLGPSFPSATGRSEQRAATVRKMALPAQDNFSAIAAEGGKLVLSGYRSGSRCQQLHAVVEPGTLRVGRASASSCDGVDFAGRRVAADLVYQRAANTETLAVATRSGSRGPIRVGPVIARFLAVAGSRPVAVDGPNAVWVWGTSPTARAEVVEIPYADPEVPVVVAMPADPYFSPLMAADADGLWMALAPNGPDTTPTPVIFVGLGGRPVRVVSLPGRAVWWLTAQGHQVWIDVLPAGAGREQIWSADGDRGGPRHQGAFSPPGGADASDDLAVAGGGGVWTFLEPFASDPAACAFDQPVQVAQVARVGPGPWVASVIATVSVPVSSCRATPPGPGAALYLRGAVYFLLQGDLYRVRVR